MRKLVEVAGVKARVPPQSFSVTEESELQVTAVPGIVMNMDLTAEDRCPSQDTARLTPRKVMCNQMRASD